MVLDRFDGKVWLRWLAGFVAFPLAGLAARAVAGPIDTLGAAALGGLAAGVTIGAVQLVARPLAGSARWRWVAATGVGLGAGLAAGAAAVGYETSAGALTVMGAVSGAGVGIAQALVLDAEPARRLAWAVATPALWALGWAVTAQVIVDADRHHATFGSSGALVVAGLSGLILAARPGLAVARAATGPSA